MQKLQLRKCTLSNEVTAIGLNTVCDGNPIFYKANREVLLCAGVFHSPQLPDLSGIGNPEILRRQETKPVVANKKVGENLQDHAMSRFHFEVINSLPTMDMTRDPEVIQNAVHAYTTKKSGTLTSNFYSFASMPLVEALIVPSRAEILKLLE